MFKENCMWSMILSFMTKERIAIVALVVLCLGLFGTIKYKESSFEKQMLIQQERYEQLQKEYFVEMTNAQTLRIAIDEQNKMIQEFNEDSKEFEAEIEKLNSSLAVKNKELKALINTTKKLVPESVKSSEDAIKWLRSNAYTLR